MAFENISLKFPQFQFGVYSPIQYTQTEPDINIPIRSMEKVEARKNMAYQTIDTVDKALATYESKLNPEDINWFNDYKSNIRNQLKQQLDAGDFGSVINLGAKLGGEAAQDTEILNRIKANTDYQNWVNSIKNDNRYDNLTKEMTLAKASNRYNYNGTGKWEAGSNPVEDRPLSVLQTMAFQMTAENISGSETASAPEHKFYDAKGNEIANPLANQSSVTAQTSSQRKTGYSRRQKTYEAMQKTWNDMMADPLIKAQLMQNYEKLMWAYKDRLAKSQDMTRSEEERARLAQEAEGFKAQLVDKNGMFYDGFDNWSKATVVPGLENMAYDNITTNTIDSNNYSLGVSGQGRGSGSGDNTQNYNEDLDEGPEKTTPIEVEHRDDNGIPSADGLDAAYSSTGPQDKGPQKSGYKTI